MAAPSPGGDAQEEEGEPGEEEAEPGRSAREVRFVNLQDDEFEFDVDALYNVSRHFDQFCLASEPLWAAEAVLMGKEKTVAVEAVGIPPPPKPASGTSSGQVAEPVDKAAEVAPTVNRKSEISELPPRPIVVQQGYN